VNEAVQPVITPIIVGAVPYTINIYVVWQNASGGHANAYKKVYAVVSWNEQGNPVTATQSVLVYPGGLGVSTGQGNQAPTGTSTPPDSVAGLAGSLPDPVLLTDPLNQTEAVLSWNAPTNTPGGYVAVWSTNPTNLPTAGSSGTASGWAPTGSTTSSLIPSSATGYTATALTPNTQYYFEIVAFSTDFSAWTASQTYVTVTTQPAPVQPCSLNTISVVEAGQLAGQATLTKTNFYLSGALTMTVAYSGTCPSTVGAVTVQASVNGTPDPGSPYALTYSASPPQYTTTYCPHNVGFGTGTHTYTVWLNGVQTSLSIQVAFAMDKKATAAC
jgi:hypothetical protein